MPMRTVVIFALCSSASALSALDAAQHKAQIAERNLASFENKDLKDYAIYQNYLSVREMAKEAHAALKAVTTDPELAKDDVYNEDDKNEDEIIQRAVQRTGHNQDTTPKKAELVEKKTEEHVEEKTEEHVETIDEIDEEVAEKSTTAHNSTVKLTSAQQAKLHAKKLIKRAAALKDKRRLAQEANAVKFQSAYRKASQKDETEMDLIDEGKGDYGKFSLKITGEEEKTETSAESFIELPKKSLEETMAKREVELRVEAVAHQKAVARAAQATKLCGTVQACIDKVEKKLAKGGYDREFKENLMKKSQKTAMRQKK